MIKSYFINSGIFIFLAISSFQIYAQDGIVTGTVKDIEKKEALISCSVTISNTSLGTITDENGKFKISVPRNLVSPKIVFMYTGYKADTISLTAAKNNYNVFLKPSHSTLNEVVVTGFSRETTLREDPTSIRIVSSKAIEQTTESNIIDLLVKNVPGLNAVKTGPNVSKPFIRGLGYSRVETLYDGVPQEGQQFEDEEVLAVDMYSIEKAEVLLGPTTLMYGPDALAGLVNLIPAIPKNTNKTLQGRLYSEYQSNNGLYGNGLRLNYGTDKWAFAVRGSYRIATNYQNSIDGRVYNTGFHEKNASATVVHNSKSGFTNFNASLYDNSQGIPDGSRDSLTRKFTKAIYEDPNDDPDTRPIVSDAELKSYKLSPIYQHIQHYRIYSKSQYDFKNGGSLYALGSFQRNIRKEYDFPIHTDWLGVAMRLDSYNYDFRYQLPKFSNIETTIGANGLYQTNKSVNSTDIPIPDYHMFDFGSFFFAKWKKDRYTVSGGLRYDTRHITGNDFYTREDADGLTRHVNAPDTVGAELLFPAFTKDFKGWSADLGVTYQLSEHISLKANVSRGSGAPHVSEFASNGLDGSAHSYFIGKPDLVPEYNWQEDIGLIISSRDFNASISAFNNSLEDYIYLVQLVDANGIPIELIPGNKTFQYHQSAAQLYGLEGTVDVHPRIMKGFTWLNNFSVMNGLNREAENKGKGIEGEYLPTVPPLKLWSSLIQEIKTKSHLIPLVTLRAEADINGAQNHYLALNETETATPGYTLFNASVNFTVNYTKQFPLQFQLCMNNILDKAYQSNLSRLKYFEDYSASPNGHLGIYSMGRNMCVKLIMPF